MPTWNGIVSTSTMRDTKNWACHWGLGWSRVPVNGSSNNASKGLGCGGVRTGSTTLCTSGSPGSMDALRPCSVWPCPPTRNCARAKMLNHIQRKQRAYVGDLKLNRKVVYMGREQKLQDVARQVPWEAKKPVRMGSTRYWYFSKQMRIPDVTHPVRIVLFWRERADQEASKALVSNRLGGEVIRIVLVYRHRWIGTETFHRDGKQQLGLGDCQVRSGEGQT